MNKILIVCAVLYGLWVIACLAIELRRTRRTQTPAVRKSSVDPAEIMGKSLFSLSHSQPQATTNAVTESTEDKAHTFAPEPEKRSVAKVADDELDEAFSDTPEIDVEDVPLEWNDDPPINYEQEEAEFSDSTASTSNYASGVLYEDMDEAVCVAQKEEPTHAEQQKAGETFSEIEGSDLYDKLMANSPLLEQQIRALLDGSLEREPQIVPGDMDSFDIRDFM